MIQWINKILLYEKKKKKRNDNNGENGIRNLIDEEREKPSQTFHIDCVKIPTTAKVKAAKEFIFKWINMYTASF